MHPYLGILIAQMRTFLNTIGDDHEVAIRFPGWGTSLFYPINASELKSGEGSLIVIAGVLDSGEAARVILDSSCFPLGLVAVPKPEGRPRREFGFAQAIGFGE